MSLKDMIQIGVFDDRFRYDLQRFTDKNIAPDYANPFHERFDNFDIVELFELGKDSAYANAFDSRFSNIADFARLSIEPEYANRFSFIFSEFNVPEDHIKGDTMKSDPEAHTFGVDWDELYRFSSEELIFDLIRIGKSPEEVRTFIDDMSELGDLDHIVVSTHKEKYEDVLRLEKSSGTKVGLYSMYNLDDYFKFDITIDDIRHYLHETGKILSGKSIFLLKSGIVPKEMNLHCIRNLEMVCEDMTKDNIMYLDRGSNGAIFKINDRIVKIVYDEDIENELEIMFLKSNSKNQINLNFELMKPMLFEPEESNTLIRHECLIYENISGRTISSMMIDGRIFNTDEVLRYGMGIANGLCDMRRDQYDFHKSINKIVWYHRDIHPGNIIINDKTDEPVIIDFGIATTDRHAPPKDNRRFGGMNDMVSLGQVMYYMATGEQLFFERMDGQDILSETSMLSREADDVAAIRNNVYYEYFSGNRKPMDDYFRKIDSNISDPVLSGMIKSCLLAKNHEYGKIYREFKKYKQ